MSPTTEIGRPHHPAPAAQPTRHPQGRSGTLRQLALSAAVLIATATAGCTAQPAEQPEVEPAPTTAAVVSLLEEHENRGLLAPGSYMASPFDAPANATMAPVLQIPEGYTSIGGAGILANPSDYRFLWLWNIGEVYTHPCDVGAYPKSVGPTVADLAEALATQPMRGGTDPVPIRIGGYDGLYVEISTPEDIDLSTCRDGYFYSWPGRGEQAPGQVDLLWIVDVEGQRITFDLSYSPRSDPEEVEELKKVVTTATFMPRDGA